MTTKTYIKATDLQVGDVLATYDGKFRTVTAIDVTPAAVRVLSGRSRTYWERCGHNDLVAVAR